MFIPDSRVDATEPVFQIVVELINIHFISVQQKI